MISIYIILALLQKIDLFYVRSKLSKKRWEQTIDILKYEKIENNNESDDYDDDDDDGVFSLALII